MIGDLVVCKDSSFPGSSHNNENYPKKHYYYIIRELVKDGNKVIGLRFEEIVNPVQKYIHNGQFVNMECYFDVKRFSKIYMDFEPQKFVNQIFGNKR